MTALVGTPEETRLWSHPELGLQAVLDATGSVRLGAPDGDRAALVPLVEVTATGHGRLWSGERFVETAIGDRLAYRGHDTVRDGNRERTTIRLADPETGLVAEVLLETATGAGFLRSQVRLVNEGGAPLRLESVSTLTLGGITDADGGLDGLTLHWADNDWLAECRWRKAPFREHVVPLSRFAHGHEGRGCFERCSQGSWSTGRHLPMGALTDRSGRAWLWQIESSAGWRFETGERESAAYVALFGPDDAHHQWWHTLAPGEDFRTVPAVLVRGGAGGLDTAFGELTDYRRLIRRDHPDHRTLPVIYNDYMNTLMGDPTTAKLLPLVASAARAGAEVFVIDAGWYDDDAQGWWDAVGAWEPARGRFPGGIQEVLDAIRDHGMVPGLWLEPEVVGVRSPLAQSLPPEAFFRRGGLRVTEHGRHHLDLRHRAARAHLDAVVDRLVGEWGVGYLKLDYNINTGPGTENGPESPGAGLLGHHRAHLDWMSGLLDRHPGLVLENCGSGGLRMDYAQLAVAQLQSTSDQQDPLRYPPVAAAAATAVTPEQAAVWAYPQPEHTADRIAFVLTGALLGRIHLSGFLDRMSEEQFDLVRSAVRVYKDIRPKIAEARPLWPLGLPGWEDAWLAHGLRGRDATYLAVWRRERPGAPESRTLPLPHLRGLDLRPEVLQPTTADATAEWDPVEGRLTVGLPRPDTAVLLALAGTA
ncbi:alpha-galactosidase [Streptomyces sp. SAI-135]|uniref:glycoside hydrolase family 36 protein n=1 Tax=unclassified Streptomyces TaxID=2593676 RepID=UPI002475C5B4|nr:MULTISPECIES: glycoside hydrolase family 36 protein [unclassified Streptomyces]MDH6520742.1 alpha-galactosidase [Streptomyces sp. SAI-090]MDH6572046.1 alpha-galactosidase [Streptomyces sp. SAI-117]MDH6615166.1 alpha-galactosidase [Streptomyces sp. SAI-135]